MPSPAYQKSVTPVPLDARKIEVVFFFQAEDGIRDLYVTGVHTCALPISERVEVVGGVLVLVMELADGSLAGRAAECRSRGLPGVPREELLGYLLEAAEALDWMNAEIGRASCRERVWISVGAG